jgi:hypothetical protein
MYITDKFGYWLSGLIDAEGTFLIYRHHGTYQCSFSINLRDDDYKVLDIIQRVVGLGKLQHEPARKAKGREGANPQIKWKISSKEELTLFRNMMRKYPLRAKRKRDFEIWSNALDEWNKIKNYQGRSKTFKNDWSKIESLYLELRKIRHYTTTNIVPSNSPNEGFYHWLTGLIEGEGNFMIRYHKKANHLIYKCIFMLNIRSDDRAIMEEIVKRTGIGMLFNNDRPDLRNSSPRLRWYIRNKAEANALRDMILDHKMCFITKKAVDFEIWEQALDYWNQSDNRATYHTKFDWAPMKQFYDEMIERRAYKDSPPNVRYIDYLRN